MNARRKKKKINKGVGSVPGKKKINTQQPATPNSNTHHTLTWQTESDSMDICQDQCVLTRDV